MGREAERVPLVWADNEGELHEYHAAGTFEPCPACSGRYDQRCPDCEGLRVVLVPDRHSTPPEVWAAWTAYTEAEAQTEQEDS